MKIVVNDFAGHPFQLQLSRELSKRGHQILHTYFADLSGPKGSHQNKSDDCDRLSIEPIRIGESCDKYSYLGRLKAHHGYCRLLKDKIRSFQPDVVISGNMPTDAQARLSAECLKRDIGFVHWIQDFYALALETLLKRRVGVFGKALAAPFHHLERQMFQTSNAVVYISEDFSSYAASAGYAPKKSVVIENWASLEEIPESPKDNEWSRKHNLHDKFVFLYSGTMGLKHSPHLLAALARKFKHNPDVRVVLVSEGIGREVLKACKEKEGLDNLLLFDFQPYATLPQVLGSADVLLASVERDSSIFSVPSKILSYLCAGRSVLIAVSKENLAARIITKSQAGYVCDPGNPVPFLERAETLISDRDLCRQMGRNARVYAESTFDITKIGDLFEDVLRNATTITSFPLRDPAIVPQYERFQR